MIRMPNLLKWEVSRAGGGGAPGHLPKRNFRSVKILNLSHYCGAPGLGDEASAGLGVARWE
jgi:hypothetical protein